MDLDAFLGRLRDCQEIVKSLNRKACNGLQVGGMCVTYRLIFWISNLAFTLTFYLTAFYNRRFVVSALFFY